MVSFHRSQSFCDFDRSLKLGISSRLQCVTREFDDEFGQDTVVFEHPTLPCEIGGNRQSKNVSVTHLVGAAAEQPAGGLRSHNGCQIILLRESGDHLASARGVLVYQQYDSPVESSLAESFGNHEDGFLNQGVSRC